jgi:hypothetical protein
LGSLTGARSWPWAGLQCPPPPPLPECGPECLWCLVSCAGACSGRCRSRFAPWIQVCCTLRLCPMGTARHVLLFLQNPNTVAPCTATCAAAARAACRSGLCMTCPCMENLLCTCPTTKLDALLPPRTHTQAMCVCHM